MGGGGIIALTMVIFSDIIPLRQRLKYWSLIQIMWAFGWGTVRTAHFLEMGPHHQVPLLCLEPCHRACCCQAQI